MTSEFSSKKDPVVILPTKIFVPSTRQETVLRARLIKLIEDDFKEKIIVVTAPAGFGKTTLVCNWIGQYNYSTAWYSIDESDNEISIFISYLTAAFQSVDGLCGGDSFSLILTQSTTYKQIITQMVRDCLRYERDLILVLEDYHFVEAKEIHELVDFLLKHKPQNLHVVLISRTDPSLPLHSYRAKNRLTEIRVRDLCFSDDEAYAFFNKIARLNLSSENVRRLNQKTEGWVTGLQMAALSMKSSDNIPGFIESFTGDNRYIMDYLLEEVLSRQPAQVKQFLLETSILHRFNESLCASITGLKNCQDIILKLERENLFIIPLD